MNILDIVDIDDDIIVLFAIVISAPILMLILLYKWRNVIQKSKQSLKTQKEEKDIFHSCHEDITEKEDKDPILEQLFDSLSEEAEQMTMKNSGLKPEDIRSKDGKKIDRQADWLR